MAINNNRGLEKWTTIYKLIPCMIQYTWKRSHKKVATKPIKISRNCQNKHNTIDWIRLTHFLSELSWLKVSSYKFGLNCLGPR